MRQKFNRAAQGLFLEFQWRSKSVRQAPALLIHLSECNSLISFQRAVELLPRVPLHIKFTTPTSLAIFRVLESYTKRSAQAIVSVQKRLSISRIDSIAPLIRHLQCLVNSYFMIALLTVTVDGFGTPTFFNSPFLAVRNISTSPRSHSKIADDTFCINDPYQGWLLLLHGFEILRMKCQESILTRRFSHSVKNGDICYHHLVCSNIYQLNGKLIQSNINFSNCCLLPTLRSKTESVCNTQLKFIHST